MEIESVLVSTSISTVIYIIYKIINNYRLKSTCNQNNELIISITPPTHPHTVEDPAPVVSV